ncbi:PhzF family phenazine biosynthesis protein [Sulfuriflexus sp.]|uniref:PhzF family phenazine biosynthesis protein n=1 Tax=Sulfuriflexus sp. TaxID=2015443 RepID=UPI0028CF15DD|nr:PhzF family phenazine biosynthesis protein [Sulfuriflexus sp.]MDT8404231.1 PhzF family phenazine biosynthesis protein [Sulfuriflexus sp.]
MEPLFYIVDVFAEQPYAGNQLAVVVSQAALADDVMQKIAAETNYSETTFLTPEEEDGGGYQVRIYTPVSEIAFAGHPILGTAWVIRQYILDYATDSLLLNLKVGQITVSFECDDDRRELAWFTAPPMTLGRICDHAAMAEALGISVKDIDTESPVQQVTAGISATIVPIRSLEAINRCKLDLDIFSQLTKQGFSPLVYLFCRETHHPENDLYARFFFEANGVREDPATGNAAAFLGAYLMEYNLLSRTDKSLRIEQGYGLGRPSLVMIRRRSVDGSIEVEVGGQVVPTVKGTLIRTSL